VPRVVSEETKEKISRGQAERHRRDREALSDDPLIAKKCSREDCDRAGEWLRVPEDFPMRTRTLKDGTKRRYPAGECKRCNRARAERWKAEFVAEHGEDAWKAKWKTWNSKRDREAKRKYDREYQRFLRASNGIEPRGPWKKYRDEVEKRTETIVPTGPFKDWWKSLSPIVRARAFAKSETVARGIRRVLNNERMSLFFVDQVGVLTGHPELAIVLYPDV
jgi:hypothetical protein